MSPKTSTPKMRYRAFEFRHDQTEAETKLWNYLRAHHLGGIHFRRQHAIGEFIVDFCAPRKKLIIELDGNPHLNSRENDVARTAFLNTRGYRVLRFWNHEVMESIEKVIESIEKAVISR
jgi:very-short-patch-repair endonuclease